MSLNYNFIETITLYKDCFKYDIFWAIIISSIIFTIAFILNRKEKYINYIILILNIILVSIVSYYYISNIVKFEFSNPINNIYFYFFNTIIYLIIISIVNFKTKYKVFNYVIYGLSLINIGYSIFMTNYLYNSHILVIANIFPMIKFGNILYIIYYLIIIIIGIKKYIKK